MALVYIGLGSNKDQKIDNLNTAINLIEENKAGKVLRKSRFYETEPIDCPKGTDDFINCSIEILTDHNPNSLLRILQNIEKDMGRPVSEKGKNISRIIDLDILLYDSNVINMPELIIPHPSILTRKYVLMTLQDIKSGLFHPVKKISIEEIYNNTLFALQNQKVKPI